MSEVKLWSATSLIKLAFGISGGLNYYGQEAVAMAAVDNYRKLGRYEIDTEAVEDFKTNGRVDLARLSDWNDAIDWLIKQQWEGLASAANRGSEIHKVAEQLNLGATFEYDEILEPYVAQYRRFLEDFQPEFLMAEAPIYNLSAGYAGTLDAIVEIDGQKVVMDIKTTAHGPNAKNRKGKPRSRPPFADVALQLTLYRNAELVGLLADRRELQYRRYYVLDPESQHTEPMPQTDGGVCLVISPEDYLVVPVDTSERIWLACRHMIEVARFQAVTSKSVFGPAIQPRVAA